MMHIFDQLFAEYNQAAAQILLTEDDVEDSGRAKHLQSTFSALLEMGVIPVVNENDSVSSAEIETGRQKILGDNDSLSAVVAKLCRADLLILLSDIDGLYDADPKSDPHAKLLHQVDAGNYADGRRSRLLAGHRGHGNQAFRRPHRNGRRMRHGDCQRSRHGKAL